MIEEVVFERDDEVARALVKLSESDFISSPELSFEAADEPHGLVAIKGEEKEKDDEAL